MSNDVFDTAAAFIAAAGSYFGIPDEQVMAGSGVDTSQGTFEVVLRVALTPDDLAGVAQRMKAMQDAQELAESLPVRAEQPSDQRIRDEYIGMDKRSKSEFGSFSRYKAWRLGGGAEVTDKVGGNGGAIAAVWFDEVTDKVELPAHVYLSPAEATPQQKAMAIGQDERGNYAVVIEDLTDEQARAHGYEENPFRSAGQNPDVVEMDVHMADEMRAGYVERTVAATERLTGADGKPTSNADDFSGLPG